MSHQFDEIEDDLDAEIDFSGGPRRTAEDSAVDLTAEPDGWREWCVELTG